MTNNTRLRRQSYPPVASRVNATVGCGVALTALALCALLLTRSTHAQGGAFPADVCTPNLTSLFAPADPDAPDAYRVCRSFRSLDDLKAPDWPVEQLSASDAFAGSSASVRRRLALLYGGRTLRVSHGWRRRARDIEAVTLIAPPPDDRLEHVTTGTLIVLQVRPDPTTGSAPRP